jgi:hypothetical protein
MRDFQRGRLGWTRLCAQAPSCEEISSHPSLLGASGGDVLSVRLQHKTDLNQVTGLVQNFRIHHQAFSEAMASGDQEQLRGDNAGRSTASHAPRNWTPSIVKRRREKRRQRCAG